jgi:hypothetical protein
MTARNIGIIPGGLVDAVRYRDPSASPATSALAPPPWRRPAPAARTGGKALRRGARGRPTTARLPRRGAPSPMAGDHNEIIGPERRRAI